ncbi:aldose 1-epimerase family protein [Thioclava sp. GXIMD2076]|uniref:aldose 1-epimerase family protein n=1 Tax=Thioclava sp. GXIMD2076 TaxID=3131931 RepID=UPI0030D3D81B
MTTITSPDLTVTVSDMGAEMQSLVFRGEEFLWNGDTEWWTGRSPVLFPIVGRAPDDRIEIRGQTYDMPQHGLARRLPFTVVAQDEAHVTHELVPSEATESYPYKFRLQLTHRVTGPTLEVAATVTNEDSVPMPFGLGFHPAFRWPLPDATGAHKIELANGAEPVMNRVVKGLISRETEASPFHQGSLTLSHDLFAKNAAIFPEGTGEALRYQGETGPSLDFRFANLPNLALWQPPGAPFLCIEPWHGMAAWHGAGAKIEDRPYTMSLGVGETARFAWFVTIRE